MNVSYGPPGLKGVTTLMAVGDSDVELGATDRAIRRGSLIGAGAWLFGALTGQRTVRNAGMGATIALVTVGVMAGSFGNKPVLVTQPAAAPAPPASGPVLVRTAPAGWR